MSYMFSECENLENINNLFSFDTQNVVDMSFMFAWCTNLNPNLDLSFFETKNITNINCMFFGWKNKNKFDERFLSSINKIGINTSIKKIEKGNKDIISLKILVIGYSNIGKTSLIERYINKCYKTNYLATFGMDARYKVLQLNNKDIFLSITDTSGKEKFSSLNKMFYKGKDGILLGFDLADQYSFQKIDSYIKEVLININNEYPVNLVIFGNKCDDKENIKVKAEDIENIQEKYNLLCFQTSAKDNVNVQRVFEYLTKLILKTRGLLNYFELPENTPIEEINIIEKEDQKIEFKRIPKKKKKKFFN